MSVISEWAVKDSLTGVVYPQPNRLIAEKVAEMHRQCEVIPLTTHAPEYEYGYTWLDTNGEPIQEGPYSKVVARDSVAMEKRAGYYAYLTRRTVTQGEWEKVEE